MVSLLHERGTPSKLFVCWWYKAPLLGALGGVGLRVARLPYPDPARCGGGITTLVMMLWGIPAGDPKPITTGRQVPAGQDLTPVTDTPEPANPTGALTGRLTAERFERALHTVANSVAFRSSGQDLTTAGNLHRDGLPLRRTRPSGPGRPGDPQPCQTLTTGHRDSGHQVVADGLRGSAS
ncbi:hypothetical protein [Streptomyces tubercidicus]|uniref:Uncharacterized protein n=1 Tax=Streptomyces tubercidicus TaxID=47759 RepID=A0A640UIG5_9ACTN|nr:hypothetical protein [Streptomyces tubercidicus]WAU10697.1 hypothetical protein STRTU_000807 [Streptomyces tubercidicus]GFE35843.1 hypothetical protein Stube_05160 [Streptomyces tubercidicus]